MIGCWVQTLDQSELALTPDRKAARTFGQYCTRPGTESKVANTLSRSVCANTSSQLDLKRIHAIRMMRLESGSGNITEDRVLPQSAYHIVCSLRDRTTTYLVKQMEAEQLKVMFEQQLQLIKLLTERLSTISSQAASSVPHSVDGIAGSINEFCYEPSAGITFGAWFRRSEDLFRVDFSLHVRLLLRKLGPAEPDKYANFILPKYLRDFTFDETVHTLLQIFGEQTSLFNIRYRCMKLVKSDADYFFTHSAIVNRECERFNLGPLTEDGSSIMSNLQIDEDFVSDYLNATALKLL
ncbi:hypothetical protein T265_10383 [Opisthorchis viverrini]|uniref:DUF7083 domain-containing protein n=1 Tax=Opisthorchis viverrini TaxID=6198 RepID=A0A074Z2R2_OPIVI|nr:hypothetical protein T265_10383 [Opisthorchis viverrini]KER21258.1 hypothetical protein T265_10383 [Opisthorchis viverrini]